MPVAANSAGKTISGREPTKEGALRVDVNISVHEEGKNLGVRTEIKNIGSIHGICHAIKYEKGRQLNIIKNGGIIRNETLMWDAEENKVVTMRDKEESQDYRFMPEPNLPPLRLLLDDSSECFHESVKMKSRILDLRHLKQRIPDLPQNDRIYVIDKCGLSDVHAYNLVNHDKIFHYFKAIMEENPSRNPNTTYIVLMYQFLNSLNLKNIDLEECTLPAWHLGQIIDMLQDRRISKMTVEHLLSEILNESNSSTPSELVEKNNLAIISDREELKEFCLRVLEEEVALVETYKPKKKSVFNELVKKVLEKTNYRADTRVLPSVLTEVVNEKFQNNVSN